MASGHRSAQIAVGARVVVEATWLPHRVDLLSCRTPALSSTQGFLPLGHSLWHMGSVMGRLGEGGQGMTSGRGRPVGTAGTEAGEGA